MLRKTIVFPILIAAVLIAAHEAAAMDDPAQPSVPANLVVTEAEGRPFKIGHAYGTQQYSCLPSATGFAWLLYGPQATLFDDEADQIMTHFLSPNPDENGTPRATWQHSRDTSSVWAMAVETSTDPLFVAPGAIAWLKLRVVGWQEGPNHGDKMMRTTFIQRVNTAGGIAPATGCSAASDVGKKALVPYTTDYVFYRQ
jgi:hypothetical protein